MGLNNAIILKKYSEGRRKDRFGITETVHIITKLGTTFKNPIGLKIKHTLNNNSKCVIFVPRCAFLFNRIVSISISGEKNRLNKRPT